MNVKNYPFLIPYYEIIEEKDESWIVIDQSLGNVFDLLEYLKDNYKDEAQALERFVDSINNAEINPRDVFVFDSCLKLSLANIKLNPYSLKKINDLFEALRAIPFNLKIKEFNIHALTKYFLYITGDLQNKFFYNFCSNGFFKEWLSA
jgi:hypothetical protein